MIDYTCFYKNALPLTFDWSREVGEWDLLISSYTEAERVLKVFAKAPARTKRWLVAPEYGFSTEHLPDGAYVSGQRHEAELLCGFLESLDLTLSTLRICVDTTGFIRPHLMFLMRWFLEHDVTRFDALYSEPGHYEKREKTEFSKGAMGSVRQVSGFEGVHEPDTAQDVLIIGAGYDHELIAQVAESKDHAKKIQMFGFPSLRADMYQENLLRASRAEDAVGSRAGDESSICFSPANDPFVTADTLRRVVSKIERRRPITNLYLSPLATKPQTIGFCLYYLMECLNGPASIIFPFRESYSKATTKGISRIWRYTVEFHSGLIRQQHS